MSEVSGLFKLTKSKFSSARIKCGYLYVYAYYYYQLHDSFFSLKYVRWLITWIGKNKKKLLLSWFSCQYLIRMWRKESIKFISSTCSYNSLPNKWHFIIFFQIKKYSNFKQYLQELDHPAVCAVILSKLPKRFGRRKKRLDHFIINSLEHSGNNCDDVRFYF